MQTIYLDISNKGVVPTIYAKQGDVGRKFEVVFTDSGLPYVFPEGLALSVWYSGASGEGNYTDIGDKSAFSVNGNKVTVEMITQMLLNDGDGIMSLVLNSADGNQIGSWNIPYICEPVPGFGSEEAEEYYTAFSNAVSKLHRAVGQSTEQGGEIFNFYTDPVYTGDEPPEEFPGNTANKGAHAQNFGTHADGEYSSASGWNSTASGGIANATGRETLASGYAATTEGQSTTASGRCSHAGGKESEATGENSFAYGLKAKATKKQAFAVGEEVEATEENAFAHGLKSKATGSRSYAGGKESEATGVNAFAHGYKAKASSNTSFATGEDTEASGFYAVASGYKTKASGTCSNASGRDTEAQQYASSAQGRGTIATSRNQSVRGAYNIPDTPNADGNGKYADIVGGGKNADDRANIYTLDWDGNAEFAGKVYSGGVEVAPGGFGLGGSVTILDGYDWNTCTATGWYAAKINAPENNIWYFGEVIRLGNAQILQKASRQFGAIDDSSYFLNVERRGLSADSGVTWSWSEWEWVNPRMIPGVEYRTTERYDSKPVYVKLISFGKLPNSDTAYVSGISSQVNIVSLHGVAKGGNETNSFPVIVGGQIAAYAFAQKATDGTRIYVKAVSDASAYTAEFILKYTKD